MLDIKYNELSNLSLRFTCGRFTWEEAARRETEEKMRWESNNIPVLEGASKRPTALRPEARGTVNGDLWKLKQLFRSHTIRTPNTSWPADADMP